ncbi:hypothetical protein YC2023_093991 [Brassica napus]
MKPAKAQRQHKLQVCPSERCIAQMYVEDMGDSSIGAFIENGGDDDDIGHGYACMIHLTHQM